MLPKRRCTMVQASLLFFVKERSQRDIEAARDDSSVSSWHTEEDRSSSDSSAAASPCSSRKPRKKKQKQAMDGSCDSDEQVCSKGTIQRRDVATRVVADRTRSTLSIILCES